MSISSVIYKALRLGRLQRPTEKNSVNLEQPTKSQQLTFGPISRNHPNIKLISHHIPKTAGSSFGKALTQAYERECIFGVYKDTGASLLTNGQDISLPKDVCVLHGHFASHVNHKTMFPNAKRICWIRDPAERLWSLTKHILRNKQPVTHYQSLLKYAKKEDELSVEKAFTFVLLKPEFEVIRNDYQRYFYHISPQDFDFVGSMHRYEDGLSELENLINLPLESLKENTAPDSESLVMKYPETYLKAKSLLKSEFNLVQKFC